MIRLKFDNSRYSRIWNIHIIYCDSGVKLRRHVVPFDRQILKRRVLGSRHSVYRNRIYRKRRILRNYSQSVFVFGSRLKHFRSFKYGCCIFSAECVLKLNYIGRIRHFYAVILYIANKLQSARAVGKRCQ